MNLSVTITRFALALGIGLAPLMAQQPQKPRPFHGPHHAAKAGEMMCKRLKLTEAQEKAIKDIRAKHEESIKTKSQAAETAGKAFHEAMEKADTPVDQLKSLHKAAADARFEVMLEHRALHQEIRAQLTPEQREQAARMEGFRMGRKCGQMGFEGAGCPRPGPKACCAADGVPAPKCPKAAPVSPEAKK